MRTVALLTLVAAGAGHPVAVEHARRLSMSEQACEHGSDGVLLKLASSASRDSFDILERFGEADVRLIPSTNQVAARNLDSGVLAQLMMDGSITDVEADCIVKLDPEEEEDAFHAISTAMSWGLDRIDSRSGTDGKYDDSGESGAGAVVYVLDTGIRTSHVDFGGRALPGFSAGCPTGSESTCGSLWIHRGDITAARSCHGHGTHCASTIGGAAYGVAKGVTIVSVQVLSCQGSGSMSGIIAGIEWAMNDARDRGQPPAIISMSLGGNGANRYDEIIGKAHAAGILTVVAAGNNNGDACRKSPASTALAVTVGSTAQGDARSSFSNYGTCVDLFAPGSAITAAWSDSDTQVKTISGTSMACPHVAGMAAQLRARTPTLDPDAATAALLCHATVGAISDVPADTVNKLLYNNFNDDAAGCLGAAPPRQPPSPPSPPSPPGRWQPCRGGICCDPHSAVPQFCPGHIACEECGADACQCPQLPVIRAWSDDD